MLLCNRPTEAVILKVFYGFSHIWHPSKNAPYEIKIMALTVMPVGDRYVQLCAKQEKRTQT
jgi:hypothetical protein